MKNLLEYLNQTKVQILVIVVLTVLAYSNSLANGLVWDDHLFLESWPDIQSFQGLENVLKGSAPPSQDKIFRPVRGLIYIFDYSLWGSTPFWYHFQALFIHLSVTLLVYLIAREIFVILIRQLAEKNLDPSPLRGPALRSSTLRVRPEGMTGVKGYFAFFVALIFGLHPIHTETINYISASMETWGSLFFFLSFYLYVLGTSRFTSLTRRILLFERSRELLLYIASIFFAFLAFFTYEMTLTLPLLIVLYDMVLNQKSKIKNQNYGNSRLTSLARIIFMVRLKWRTTLIYLPYFLGVLIFIFIRTSMLSLVSRTDYLGYSFYLTQLTMVKVFARYILLLIAPFNQTAIHNLVGDFPSSMIPYDSLEPILNQSIFDSEVLISAALLLGLIIFAFKYIKRYSLVSFCILWFFIALIPVSYIIPHGGAMAEKYLYIASLGYCLLVGWFFFVILSQRRRISGLDPSGFALRMTKLRRNPGGSKLMFGGFGLLILIYFILTFNRNFIWKNDISLFSDVVAKSPDNLMANYTLGIWYGKSNDLAKSEGYYKRVLEKAPNFWEARFNLANLYLRGMDFDKATAEYDTLVKTHPNLIAAKNALSNIQVLRESTKSGVLNDQILVNYKSKQGFFLLFPLHWSIESRDDKEILKDPNEQLSVTLSRVILDPASPEKNLDPSAALQDDKESYGKLVNEGKALIPGWDDAHVRVWEDNGELSRKDQVFDSEAQTRRESRGKQILQFFLFKDGNVIQVLVNPVVPELMGEFDGILGSIKVE